MCPENFSGSNCQYEEVQDEQQSFVQVLMDDSVVIIVYALMILTIAGIFIAVYRIMKKRQAMESQDRQEESEKLTAANAGDPNAISSYEKRFN